MNTAGLLIRQQSEERELSLNNESFKLNEENWLLGIPPGYAHLLKKFRRFFSEKSMSEK